MPTLHRIGKDKAVNHHRDVPYRVLEHSCRFEAAKTSPDHFDERSAGSYLPGEERYGPAASHNAVPGKEMMLRHGIIFKKIPRYITRF